MAKDHVGILPKLVVYDRQHTAWKMPYRILSVDPEGEVQITPKTNVIVKLWDCGHPDRPRYQECYE